MRYSFLIAIVIAASSTPASPAAASCTARFTAEAGARRPCALSLAKIADSRCC